MGDGARKVSVSREDTGNVDGVVVARDTGVWLVRCRGTQLKRSLAAERNGVLEVNRLVQRDPLRVR